MDRLTPARRSWLMSRIGPKNTGPERAVASAFRALGIRFSRHRRNLPGTPDFVIRPRNLAVLVHGCFWHGHRCKRDKMPKSRRAYWGPKIAQNKARDARKSRALRELGWGVAVVWECQTKSKEALLERLRKIVSR